jgi:hypothetical protein
LYYLNFWERKKERKSSRFSRISENKTSEHFFPNQLPEANIREQISRPEFWDAKQTLLDLVLGNGNGKIKMFSTNTYK